MTFGEPQWRGGRRGAPHNPDSSPAHNVHGPLQPVEIVLAFLAFAYPPGEFTHAHDINSGGGHQFGVLGPARFGVFGRACEGIDPVFGIIISSEVHKLSWMGFE